MDTAVVVSANFLHFTINRNEELSTGGLELIGDVYVHFLFCSTIVDRVTDVSYVFGVAKQLVTILAALTSICHHRCHAAIMREIQFSFSLGALEGRMS